MFGQSLERDGIDMTPIERLEAQLTNNEAIDHFSKDDIAAVVECVREQHAWIHRKNYWPTQYDVVLKVEKKVGLEK